MPLPEAPPGWLLGVDVSQFQGALDPAGLVAAGVAFVVARASYGTDSAGDSRWRRNAAALSAAGMPFGGYGVLVPGEDPAEQARAFARATADSGAALPGWCDFELAGHESALTALRACATWCDVAEQEMGRGVLVYAGPGFVDGLVQLAGPRPEVEEVLHQLSERPLVVADYGSGRRSMVPGVDRPRLPEPWASAAVWQVGPFGATLPGTRVPVDVDWFEGTLDDFRALAEI